ncbi:MAG TPA: hemerythrin domain-containing protein [Chthoniobacteraceae bacterium]|nr:hemerythrin domain-containing protein [Chthoniobacteraceae bacterium]
MASIRKRYEKDHRELIGLLQCVQDAKESGPKEALKAFLLFAKRLERLIEHEENVLFPHFDEANGLASEGPTAVMRVEHRQIRWLLAEIKEKLSRGDLRTDAEQIVLLEILRNHQDQERAIVYPNRA